MNKKTNLNLKFYVWGALDVKAFIWRLLGLNFISKSNVYPPASEASREVANLTEGKNPHIPRIWCQRICLSVCDKI